MSKKCTKVRNPCKICLGPVTQKTGLQCQGACECWVHYACLNYTPGKIKDIKAGIIKVTCPCPDCKTTQPKEYRTDTPYSCNNSLCPANRPPKCENFECPINDPKCPPYRPPCPLSKCARKDCKTYSSPINPIEAPPQNMSPPCLPDPCDANQVSRCPSGCSSNTETSGDFRTFQGRPSGAASGGGGGGGGAAPGGGGGGPGISQTMDVVEQMCNTVGELSTQIQQLMCQMKRVVNDSQGPPPCPPPPCPPPPCPPPPCSPPPCPNKPQSKCPKPCFCPGNPCQRS